MSVVQDDPKKYIPGSGHPWRNYANKPRNNVSGEEKEKKPRYRKLRIVLSEVIENWETIEIEVYNSNGGGKRYLSEVSDDRVANWLVSFLSPYRRGGKQEEEDGDAL